MQPETSPHLPTNHVFVDLENVKTIDPAVIGGKNLILHLFFGPQNQKLDVAVVELLLEHSQTVKLVRSRVAGKNALDFVLAYHLGQAVLTDPKGYFHLVSKDAGFDSLVDLLRSKNVKVKRHDDWSALHFHATPKPPTNATAPAAQVAAKPVTPKPLSAGAENVLERLKKSVKNRPRRQQTLLNHAKDLLGKETNVDTVGRVVEELKRAGHLKIDDKGAVTYML